MYIQTKHIFNEHVIKQLINVYNACVFFLQNPSKEAGMQLKAVVKRCDDVLRYYYGDSVIIDVEAEVISSTSVIKKDT